MDLKIFAFIWQKCFVVRYISLSVYFKKILEGFEEIFIVVVGFGLHPAILRAYPYLCAQGSFLAVLRGLYVVLVVK